MQNIFLIISIFILASCGIEPTEDDVGSNIGEIWEASESNKLSESEVKTLKNICAVLEDKENYYKRTIINSARTLKYSLKETACGAAKATEKSFTSSIVESFGKLALNTSESIAFKNIILKDSKEMASFCDSTSDTEDTETGTGTGPVDDISSEQPDDSVSRVVKTGTTALRYYFYDKKSKNCQVDGDEVCMYIEVGHKLNNGSFKTKDINAFKISLNSSNNFRGVVLERALISSDLCDDSEERYLKEQFYMGFN
ncbi:MAG: hypothetical protein ACJAS4_000119 [Bacteriovoracaceae bacterium]|jgi:hypothetical protein